MPSLLTAALHSPADWTPVLDMTSDRYRDLMPPAGWQPKSAFFKSIWAKSRFARLNKKLTLPCPNCGADVTLSLSVQDHTDTPTSIRGLDALSHLGD